MEMACAGHVWPQTQPGPADRPDTRRGDAVCPEIREEGFTTWSRGRRWGRALAGDNKADIE